MIYRFGDSELDTARFELRRSGEPVSVEPQVLDVLAHLLRHRDRLVTKEELLSEIWSDRFVTEATLASRIMAARRAVGDDGRSQAVIRTVHGRGFRFVAEVEEVGAEGPDAASDGEGPLDAGAAAAEPPPCGPRAEPPMTVAREAELARLRAALDRARTGLRRLVFVTGEPGLGKTTLVEAFLAGIEEPVRCAVGQCLESRGTGEAYLPVLEAIDRLCREPEGGTELVELLAARAPTWLAQMPWLVAEGERPRIGKAALGATRDRMLREIVHALEAASAAAALVLVLEDLHWSDPSTLDLLERLAGRREPARLLVVGTLRPADARAASHPSSRLVESLELRGGGERIALSLFDRAAVADYLARRFPEAELGDRFAALLERRTEGNPLFLGAVLDAWIADGRLRRDDGGRWYLADDEGLAEGLPDSLRQLVEERLIPIDPADRRLLEAASVAGLRFSAATAAAAAGESVEAVEERLEVLARRGLFVERRGVAEWPDGTLSARFGFLHDLYQEVLYGRVPAGRRARLHGEIGDRLETGYGARAEERAPELAHHFVRARDSRRAARHLHRAGRRELARSAHREAIEHLTRGLEEVERLPGGTERDHAELDLRAALAPALVATRGWSEPEVEGCYLRAWELARELGVVEEKFPVVYGLATLREIRGEYAESQRLMEASLGSAGEEGGRLESLELLACSQFHQGAFADALEHAERALERYDPAEESELTAALGENPGVCCHDWAALALWFLGRPDAALERARRALELAREHVYTLAHARSQAAAVHQLRGETEEVMRFAESSIEVAVDHGFPYRVGTGRIFRGWAMSRLGEADEGLGEIDRGLEVCERLGAKMDHPYFLALDAEARLAAGRAGDALDRVERALALARAMPDFYYRAELLRLRAELGAAAGGRDAEEVESILRRALALAREQSSPALALRAATSLAHRLAAEGRRDEARRLLAPLYDAFDEGAETADLVAARRLLAGEPGALAGEPGAAQALSPRATTSSPGIE